jgi:hypothetical protein
MNRNLTAVVFTVAALGLVAVFDIIPGAGIAAGIALLAASGVLFIGQLIESSALRLWWR